MPKTTKQNPSAHVKGGGLLTQDLQQPHAVLPNSTTDFGPDFKDQARTVQPPAAAPASNRPANNDFGPDFKDQARSVQHAGGDARKRQTQSCRRRPSLQTEEEEDSALAPRDQQQQQATTRTTSSTWWKWPRTFSRCICPRRSPHGRRHRSLGWWQRRRSRQSAAQQ